MTELVDRIICAAAQAFKDDGEVLITGIGVVPRLAASLAMLTINTDIMMTDSEAYVVSEPVPIEQISSSVISYFNLAQAPAIATIDGSLAIIPPSDIPFQGAK